MKSMAHGRNYLIGHGNPNGAPKVRKARFECRGPDNSRWFKDVPNGVCIKEPVSLFYKNGDKWVLSTVVDKKNFPDWAANYTIGTAVLKTPA